MSLVMQADKDREEIHIELGGIPKFICLTGQFSSPGPYMDAYTLLCYVVDLHHLTKIGQKSVLT